MGDYSYYHNFLYFPCLRYRAFFTAALLFFASLRSANVGHPCGVPAPLRHYPPPQPLPGGEGLTLTPNPLSQGRGGISSLAPLGSGRLRRRFLLGEPPARVPPMKTVHRTVFIPPSCAFLNDKSKTTACLRSFALCGARPMAPPLEPASPLKGLDPKLDLSLTHIRTAPGIYLLSL